MKPDRNKQKIYKKNEHIKKIKEKEQLIDDIENLNEILENKQKENAKTQEFLKQLDIDINKSLEKLLINYNEQEQQYEKLLKNIEIKNEEIKKKNTDDLNLKIKEFELNKLNQQKNIEDEYKKIKEKKELIDKEHQEFIEDFNKQKLELENEYNSKLTYLDDYEKDLEITNKIKYDELYNKLNDKRKEFDIFMSNKKNELNEEIKLEIEKQNKEFEILNKSLEDKKIKLESDYSEKLKELKIIELNLFTKNKELIEQNKKINNKINKFKKNKRKFTKRNQLILFLFNVLNKNKKKFYLSLSFCLIFIIYFIYNFEANLFKSTFISNSFSKTINVENYDNSYNFSLDTSNSILKEFKDLDSLSIKLNYLHNNTYKEDLNDYKIFTNNKDFEYKRFYKNNTMIMKSISDPQYIIINDLKNSNYNYKTGEFNYLIYEAFEKYLSKLKNKDYVSLNKINTLKKDTFFDYIKNTLFINKNYDYYYEINKPSNELFIDIFSKFINSENYNSFFIEEKDIQEKLDLSDNLKNSKNILENIIKYSKVKNTIVNIKISKAKFINIIDIKFDLLYKDETMANEIPITIRISCNFDELKNLQSFEDPNFTKNAILLENLKKRENVNEFKETKSIPFTEQSTTLKNLK